MRPLLSMRWRDLLFAHWSIDPATVAAKLPDGVSVDTYDGDAYLGVVPFVMDDIRVRAAPLGLQFGELNLRTYVTVDGTPGVYFFNLDADDRLGVTLARKLFRLPYYRAEMDIETTGTTTDREVSFQSRRRTPSASSVRFDARYGPNGEFTPPAEGSLAEFLTERYRFYTTNDSGRIYYGDIDHEPWSLAEATADIEENTLFEANGFDRPDGEPVLHFAAPIDVTAGRIKRR